MNYVCLIIADYICKCKHQFENIWRLRNQAKHGKDVNTRIEQSKLKIERRIRACYAQQAQVMYEDSHVFQEDVETHLQQPLSKLRNWLSCYSARIKQSVKQAQRQASKNIKLHAWCTVRRRVHPLRPRNKGNTMDEVAVVPVKQQCITKYLQRANIGSERHTHKDHPT